MVRATSWKRKRVGNSSKRVGKERKLEIPNKSWKRTDMGVWGSCEVFERKVGGFVPALIEDLPQWIPAGV